MMSSIDFGDRVQIDDDFDRKSNGSVATNHSVVLLWDLLKVSYL